MTASTTLLGRVYPGKPMFGTLALYLCNLEAKEGREAAQKSFDSHNAVQTAFGGKPIDLSSQFTTASPMSMSTRLPKMLAIAEDQLTEVHRDRDPDTGNERVAA